MKFSDFVSTNSIRAALASSVADKPLPPRAVFLGEVGLGGEIRPVSQAERRLAEAAKLGMTQVFLSERVVPRRTPKEVQVVGVSTLQGLLQKVLGPK